MIYGFIHPGSGLGNSLHRYVATRVLAFDKGYKFSMIGRENFKGNSFIHLDFGLPTPKEWNYLIDPSGKIIVDTHFDGTGEFEEKTKYYNPEFNFIEDCTIIDGEFQDERYFEHRLSEIDNWLKVRPIDVPDDICLIGFRGGEFSIYPDLFLTPDYWAKGMEKMLEINPKMKFEVHTDDPKLAYAYFPDFKIIHDIGINWRSMRYAKYAIIANSSFYILPRLLPKDGRWPRPKFTIAPRYWARRNIKEWSMPQNYYKQFTYI